MGADIYLSSIVDPARAKNRPLFDDACERRNRGDEGARADVEKYYDAMYPPEGYFRDSYNDTSLYWLLGRSWWQDSDLVQPGKEFRNEEGELTEAGIAKALEMQRSYLEGFRKDAESFDEKFDAWLAKPGKHATIDDDKNTPDAWRKMFRSKLDRWIAMQERAVALGEPLRWSV